ncbi:MAG: MFS transporter [Lactobacillaceae bacterium]|jgi:CP family cyanate transporter-like MFS transporter|nr:MFS transporter [Lactobacillaceae bacterium]
MNNKTKGAGVGLLIALVLVGFVMRSQVTTLPLILDDIAITLHVQSGDLGIITTIPLVMFMLVSNFASKTVQLIGLKKALMGSLLLICAGSDLRIVPSFSAMIGGTILIGLGVAHLNVLMPAFLMEYAPNKIALYTSAYSFSMMFGVAVFNLLTAHIVYTAGLPTMMFVLFSVPAIALLTWIVVTWRLQAAKQDEGANPETKQENKPIKVWTKIKAWPFLLVFGGQSLINYTFVAWMPSLMSFHHLTATQIGIAMSMKAFIGMPMSMIIPNLLVRSKQRGIVNSMLVVGSLGLIGALMLFFQDTSSMIFWSIECLISGIITSFFYMSLMTLFAVKTSSPMASASLAGMAQTGGYLMAATGPILYGMAFQANPTGSIQNIIYVLVIIMLTAMGLFVAKSTKFE